MSAIHNYSMVCCLPSYEAKTRPFSELGNLRKLQTLEASRNNLVALPEELGNCSELRVLSLDKNRLKVFPRQLCLLRQLTELSLCGNQLEYLPPGMPGEEC